MKELMRKAHQLTREIKKEFPEVDYKTQLGICISYLSKDKEVKMVELKGSEKQVAWAKNIRERIINECNEMEEKYQGYLNLGRLISVSEKRLQQVSIMRKVIETEDSAKWWIENVDNMRHVSYVVDEVFGKKFFTTFEDVKRIFSQNE